MRKFEVSVPLVVEVEVDDEGNARAGLARIDNRGWGGFFSEAEDAEGVWEPDADQWVRDDFVGLQAARRAWQHVRAEMQLP